MTSTRYIAGAVLLGLVRADPQRGGGGPWGWGGNNGDNDDNNNNNNNSFGSRQNGFGFGNAAGFDHANTILIAHAVIASAVWVLLVPSAALLLRINVKSPIILKLHAFFQIFSYMLYIVAAGMGIWLAQRTAAYGTWENVHPRLGLAILAIAFFQPIFGFVHHRIYKKRASGAATGTATKKPGRTPVGRVHVWVGRSLIILGMVNGGLGIRLASRSPFRTDSQTRTASIAYAVAAAVMFILYVTLVVLFEIRRKRAQPQEAEKAPTAPTAYQQNKLPTYDESQSSSSSVTSRRNTGAAAAGPPAAPPALPRYS